LKEQRINSSNVPTDFDPSDPTTDPRVVEKARPLSDQLQDSPEPREASMRVAENLETDFNQQVEYFYDLGPKYSDDQQPIQLTKT